MRPWRPVPREPGLGTPASENYGRECDPSGLVMNRDGRAILAVAAGAAVLVLGFMALRPGTSEIEYLPSVTLDDPQDLGPSAMSAAVVLGTDQSGGSSFLWLDLGSKTYSVTVQFYAPPGCFELVEFGDQWPVPYPECSSDIPVAGEVTGLGNTPTGESMVAVDVEVARDCFDNVARGSSWPPAVSACTPGDS